MWFLKRRFALHTRNDGGTHTQSGMYYITTACAMLANIEMCISIVCLLSVVASGFDGSGRAFEQSLQTNGLSLFRKFAIKRRVNWQTSANCSIGAWLVPVVSIYTFDRSIVMARLCFLSNRRWLNEWRTTGVSNAPNANGSQRAASHDFVHNPRNRQMPIWFILFRFSGQSASPIMAARLLMIYRHTCNWQLLILLALLVGVWAMIYLLIEFAFQLGAFVCHFLV